MEYNIFGFKWRLGRSWGLAHPDDICYADDSCVVVANNDYVQLGIEHKPTIFDVGKPDPFDPELDTSKLYPWAIGYISTIDTIKYGYLKVEFELPLGKELWPAIWLTDCKTWPPEIDIMEAWSGHYSWPIFKPKSPEGIYRLNPFVNDIFPSVHIGTNPEEHDGYSYKKLGGTCRRYIDASKVNTCELIWSPDMIQVFYNNHKVMEETRPQILKYFNNSEGMEIHLNNYVTNKFTINDYNAMESYNKYLRIQKLEYDPDYKSHIKK